MRVQSEKNVELRNFQLSETFSKGPLKDPLLSSKKTPVAGCPRLSIFTHTRWSPSAAYSLGDGTFVILTPSSLTATPPPGPPMSVNCSWPLDLDVRRNEPKSRPRLPGLLPPRLPPPGVNDVADAESCGVALG